MFFSFLKSVEKSIVTALVVLMVVVLFFAALDLGWVIIRDLLLHEPRFLLSVDDLLDIFGLFLLVLIGIELLETIVKTYLKQKSVHVEIVLSVAIIAIARKVIIMDVKDLTPLGLLGIASLTFSLCAGYFLLRKGRFLHRAGSHRQGQPHGGGNGPSPESGARPAP